MDNKTALALYRRRKLRELSARCHQKDRPDGQEGGIVDFAYRDEYGRYQEDNRKRNAGIGAGAAAGALGAGLYARGRIKGSIGASGAERYARDRFQGLVNRGQAGINSARVADGTYKRNAMKDAAVGAGRSVRDAGSSIGKVTRKSLRKLLLRGAMGLR